MWLIVEMLGGWDDNSRVGWLVGRDSRLPGFRPLISDPDMVRPSPKMLNRVCKIFKHIQHCFSGGSSSDDDV